MHRASSKPTDLLSSMLQLTHFLTFSINNCNSYHLVHKRCTGPIPDALRMFLFNPDNPTRHYRSGFTMNTLVEELAHRLGLNQLGAETLGQIRLSPPFIHPFKYQGVTDRARCVQSKLGPRPAHCSPHQAPTFRITSRRAKYFSVRSPASLSGAS